MAMKRRKWFCLLLSAVLLLAGCQDAEKNTGGGMSGRHDYEITEEMAVLPLQEGETILWAQYLEGERVWFLESDEGQLLCYHEDKGERELFLERVPAAFTGCSLYTDGENFYAYQTDKLTVLDAAGKERYTLQMEGGVSDLCMSREGSIVLAIESDGNNLLKTLDVESGTLSGGRLSPFFVGLGTGMEQGILVMDEIGVYDLDMESGERSWHMKWNGLPTSPRMKSFFVQSEWGRMALWSR